MRVAIYARVSTFEQNADSQIMALREVGERLGWTITETFVDVGLSGIKGREKRPSFDKLLKAVARREIDLVAAWDISRISRSVADLIAFLNEIHSRNVGLYLHQQGIDTTTPSGKAMFTMLGAFAEFERAILAERVRASLHRLRAEGRRLGRPPVPETTVARIREELHAGHGIHKTARLVGCGVGTVQRVRTELRAAS
jgi:DNA invertase Pin-like site-specific DNA recombinase